MSLTKPQQYACLGKLLRDARLAAGLTQRRLATRLGWVHSRVAKIEVGKRRVTVEEFVELARVVRFDVERLLAEFSELVQLKTD